MSSLTADTVDQILECIQNHTGKETGRPFNTRYFPNTFIGCNEPSGDDAKTKIILFIHRFSSSIYWVGYSCTGDKHKRRVMGKFISGRPRLSFEGILVEEGGQMRVLAQVNDDQRQGPSFVSTYMNRLDDINRVLWRSINAKNMAAFGDHSLNFLLDGPAPVEIGCVCKTMMDEAYASLTSDPPVRQFLIEAIRNKVSESMGETLQARALLATLERKEIWTDQVVVDLSIEVIRSEKDISHIIHYLMTGSDPREELAVSIFRDSAYYPVSRR